MGSGLWFVIPAYNEARAIGGVVTRTRELYPCSGVAVVNDGSRDETGEVARAAGACVVDLPFNSGYGVALHTGLRWAQHRGADTVVTLDADGQHDPGEAARLIEPVAAGACDLALGSRYLANGAKYRVPVSRRMGSLAFAALVSALMGQRITDPTSGFQSMNRRVLDALATLQDFPEKTPDADLLLHVHRLGARIAEVPVRMYADAGGDSMHGLLKSAFYAPKMLVAVTGVLLEKNR